MKDASSKNYSKRLIVIYTLCILFGIVPLLLFTLFWVKPKNLEQTNAQTQALVESKASEVGAWLDQRISEIRIINAMVTEADNDITDLKPYITRINQVVREYYGNPDETFAVGGTDGKGWINDELIIDVSNRDYFIEVMNSDREYIIGSPLVSKSDNTQAFIICYPVRDNNGTPIGFINGAISLDRLGSVIEDLSVLDGESWVMNTSGIMYTRQTELIDRYSDSLSLISSQAENGDDRIEVNIQGENITIFYAHIPYADNLLLCTAIETSVLTRTTTTIMTTLISSALIAGILICLASYFLSRQMVDENKRLIEEVSIVDDRRRKAEIRALQTQINPHFLYNSLDTIQWKALEYNAFDIAEMIQKLSQIFRVSLSHGKEYIPLSDEITHVQSYLDIQKIRYKEKISYDIQMADGMENLYVPKLIIQPLVENSIYHGIKESDTNGHILVAITHPDHMIQITVKDDGKGVSDEVLSELKSMLESHKESDHYGMYNVYEKLILTYGPQCSFEIASDHGFEVTMKFPDQLPKEMNR